MAPRRTRLFALALLPAAAALAISGCGLFPELSGSSCPNGTDLTLENFGRPFMDKYCNYCHGSTILDRKGAPPAYVFETPEQIEKWAARIYVRAAGPNDSMPPGPDDPPREERDKLEEWLACTYGPDAK
ncbi:MAG: hypothetical protein U0441_23560 [Polyangiaceae bacterium]